MPKPKPKAKPKARLKPRSKSKPKPKRNLILRIFELTSAFWLIANMSLDSNQTRKYYRYSPQLNSDHEANSNLTTRIQKFCGNVRQIKFTPYDNMTDFQNNLYGEWKERCRTTNFSFSISYGISPNEIRSAKVSNDIIIN